MAEISAGKFVRINGRNLYVEQYYQYPDRPTIVFLHDSLGSVQLWRDFPQKLAAATQCNLLLYDRLGYGQSEPMPTYVRPVNYMEQEADILYELLTALEIDSAILFGHSDGGTIALLTASKYPAKIKAVVAEAAHIFVEDVTLNGIYKAIDAYKNTNLVERLSKYHGEKTDTLFKAWTETWTRADYRTWNIEHLLKNIVCPLLFIQGESDEYGTLMQVEKTITQVSGSAEKYLIPNIGHTPHKEAPQLTLDKSIEFIKAQLSDN
jgi:pimeloyl-ACP methyl ester carboxylesterase